jgi:N-acetylmuramoyl-L-alanine amidase
MIAPVCAALALALAAPAPAARSRPARAAAAQRPSPREKAAPSQLDRARATLAAVKRDPTKRRLRHRWEHAIAELERAARGRDRGPALLEAARARYALYRYSQVEADREEALRLASRADRAGAKEAAPLARAIRKEMGDAKKAPLPSGLTRAMARYAAEAGRRTGKASPTATANANATPTPTATPTANANATPTPTATSTANGTPDGDDEEEEALDPALEKALAKEEQGSGPGAAAPAGAREQGPARVSEVKTWSNSDYTRIAVYLSRPVAFAREELAADADHPRRLALDLAPARLASEVARPVAGALVTRVRAAQRDGDTVRVVLDLAGKDELSVFSLDDPPRLIVDVGVAEARRAARASALSDGGGELAARRPVRRIVVDAGHGGHDTGAIGPTRVREKDITLAMAKRLARRLESKGFEVVLTRRDDRFVPLEERTAIANAGGGDLFVSLHANAHPRRDRRGVETYVLNVADDRYARRLAARENGALDDRGEGDDVRRILTDLEAQSSADASRRLAQSVQRELCLGIRGHVGDVRDLGVKSALFHVLLGARMPAVLVETSFISNRAEEQRLASPRFQDEVAGSLARAIERFAAREARVASAR